MRTWARIIMHHSATLDGGVYDWGAIRWYHTVQLGWSDIGYHAGVEMIADGAGRKHWQWPAGRPLWEAGAHTIGQNVPALGVCVVGDYDKAVPPAGALLSAATGVAQLCMLYDISVEEIRGHREFASKTCPGKHFDLVAFRKQVASLIAAHR